MEKINFLERPTNPEDHGWYQKCAEIEEYRNFYFPIWERNQKLLDTNFIQHVKKDPYSRFYELYILDNLQKGSFEFKEKNKNEKGPDFITRDNKVAFECIAPSIAEDYEPPSENKFIIINNDLKKLRITQALSTKIIDIDKEHPSQFHKWKTQNEFEGAFVICISGSKLQNGENPNKISNTRSALEYGIIDYGDLGTTDDPIAQVLYGYLPKLVVEPSDNPTKPFDFILSLERNIFKDGKPHDINGIFRREEFLELSAVIFTPYDGIQMISENKKSFLYPNPNAKVKLTKEIEFCTPFYLSNNG